MIFPELLQIRPHPLSLISIPHNRSNTIRIYGNKQCIPFQRQPQYPPVGMKVRKEKHAAGPHNGHDTQVQKVIGGVGGCDKNETAVAEEFREGKTVMLDGHPAWYW
jgi:hypothetical protein